MNLGLQGKTALLTGGARDVGAAIVRALAAEGARVAVNYHHSAEAAAALVADLAAGGAEARAYRADVADHGAVGRMIEAVTRDFGGLDILVNNAGLVQRQWFVDTTPDDWQRQIGIGLYGAIHCCHAAIPHMIARGGGRIISLVGDSSRVGEAGLAIGAAARGGVLALTKSLAKELGRSAITANAVALGLVETSHIDRGWLDANREKITRLYPLRRLGREDDVAPMVVFLAGAGADWITGQVLSINGGFSMAG
ncbi:MAG TPA: SDR family oxidoreductase [Stellaceae bacterium]|nr:SDR family oxidoreductase [Stellaceae bacterium]